MARVQQEHTVPAHNYLANASTPTGNVVRITPAGAFAGMILHIYSNKCDLTMTDYSTFFNYWKKIFLSEYISH